MGEGFAISFRSASKGVIRGAITSCLAASSIARRITSDFGTPHFVESSCTRCAV